jgi:hypothetical protein
LWASITTDYDLEQHELALLIEAVRTVDALDLLDAAVRSEGAIVDSPQGSRANPALVEARAQRVVLARLLAALRLPCGEAGDAKLSARPQRRSGARGVYGIRGAVS